MPKINPSAAAIYHDHFATNQKSPEWKAGALRGLQVRLGEATTGPSLPYTPGTAQYDAWAAGIQAGQDEAKYQIETLDGGLLA